MPKKLGNWLMLIVLLTTALTSACSKKPAYSDIDPNRPRNSDNRNAQDQASSAQPGAAEAQPAAPAQPPAPAPLEVKKPSFMDDVTGDIKDLPLYPGANRTNARIGPVSGSNLASWVLQSDDPMDKIVAFYERAIKANRWSIVGKTADPEIYEWVLAKGQDDSGRVQIKKDPQIGKMLIFVIRGETLKEEKK